MKMIVEVRHVTMESGIFIGWFTPSACHSHCYSHHTSNWVPVSRFPVQDGSRLQQRLKNMGLEDRTPTRHQHSDPSCSRTRRGFRCTEKNTLPTAFQECEEKRKATDLMDRQAKRFHVDADENRMRSDGEVDNVDCSLTSTSAEFSLLESGIHFPLTFLQTVENEEENTQVLVMTEDQDQLLTAIASALSAHGHRLVLTHGLEDGESEGQVISLYQTSPQLGFSSDTVLASALSSHPITSTLPIVSNHVAPPTISKDEGDEERSEDEDPEPSLDQKLEEHSYHRSSVTKEQLQRTVRELQQQVKVLQQQQVEQLLCLENAVTQLKHNDLLNQERLQLLERVYLQSGTGALDAGETVTIIYEEENGSYLWPSCGSVKLNTP
ncbi:centrosome-associated protein CEP250-like [Gouania willdenowi]|uniref:centrosome-associated protein CEP250-like n=1 Tax=Gouania willdenowi TaxID=441366 RepID=UPI00105424C4|nr:centrosome-associated protein CEP250-like [Gouania willdenowi]